jgi:hypothetical protein
MLTMDTLMDACRLIDGIEKETGRPVYPTPFNGIDVICDHNALADTTERTFPISRHRSRRTHKKLMKRFAGEFKKQPAIFQIQGRIYAHPARYAELRAWFDRTAL